jgi:hypothetical protein
VWGEQVLVLEMHKAAKHPIKGRSTSQLKMQKGEGCNYESASASPPLLGVSLAVDISQEEAYRQ